MPRNADSRLNATALLALLVSIFGTMCLFWGIAGLAAIVLGIVALHEIKRSEGKQHGQGLAIAGVVLGGLHLLALGVGLAALFVFAARPPAFLLPHGRGTSPPSMAVPTSPAPPPTASPPLAERPGASTREPSTRTTTFGKLTVVDPGAEATALGPLLDAQGRLAAAAHQKLMLLVTTTDCAPCNGVSVALGSRQLQDALAGVRLVRVDVVDFRVELEKIGVPIDVEPGFALLGSDRTPIDYVNGGEWDADIPQNIAPVLGSFVRGSYRTRRNPWRGPPRPDETAL